MKKYEIDEMTDRVCRVDGAGNSDSFVSLIGEWTDAKKEAMLVYLNRECIGIPNAIKKAKEYVESMNSPVAPKKAKKEYRLQESQIEIKGIWEMSQLTLRAGMSLNQDWNDPELLATFSSKEEGLKALSEYRSSVSFLSNFSGIKYALITEYYLEEYSIDEDGDAEPIECVDFSEF